MHQIELYIRVIPGTPLQLGHSHTPPDPENTKGHSYWALLNELEDDTPVLMHVYYRGAMPEDHERDKINNAIADYTIRLINGHLNFGEIYGGSPRDLS